MDKYEAIFEAIVNECETAAPLVDLAEIYEAVAGPLDNVRREPVDIDAIRASLLTAATQAIRAIISLE